MADVAHIETLSNEDRVTFLAAANNYTSSYLSDQNVFHFGSNRKSHITGTIGNTGQPFEELYNDYLESL